MKDSIIQARIKRTGLDRFAGENYRDADPILIKEISNSDSKAFAGIQKDNGVFTVLGAKFVHFRSKEGFRGKILNEEFSQMLHENAMQKGKKGSFEFIKIHEGNSVWLQDINTMNALWNTLLLILNNSSNGTE